MKKILALLVILVLVGGAAVTYWRRSSGPASSFRTAPVKRGDLMVTVGATGTVEPEEVVDVGAQVAGKIEYFGQDPHQSGKLLDYGSPTETVAVFLVRRDVEYGLSFYRNHQVVNYKEEGVPAGQHLLVARIAGRGGKDLQTQAALDELLAGRHYEQLFTWPEQDLAVYMVGAR